MLKDINQIKALTLLVSSKIGAASSDELISAVLATELVDIADIADVFVFLSEDGLLTLSNGTKQCCISEKGKAILPELLSMLGTSVAEEALEKAVRFHKGAEYSAEITEADGKFVLVCSFYEKGQTMCEIKLYFDDENEAIRSKINFLKRSDAVMGAVKASVTGNVGYMM